MKNHILNFETSIKITNEMRRHHICQSNFENE